MDNNNLPVKELIKKYREEQRNNIIFREDFSRLNSPKYIQMNTLVDDQHYSTEYQILSNDILNLYNSDYFFDLDNPDYTKYLEATPLSSKQIQDIKERHLNRNYYDHYQKLKELSTNIERRPHKKPQGYFKYLKNECSDYSENDYYLTTLDDSDLNEKYQHKHGWLFEYITFYSINFSPPSGSRYYYWLKNRHSFDHKYLPKFEFEAPNVPVNMILSMFYTINPRIDKAETELEKTKELCATFNYFVDWLLWSIGYPYMNNTLKEEGINPEQYSDYILENSHNILAQMDWEVLYLWQCNFLQEIWDLLFEHPSEVPTKELIKEQIKELDLDNSDVNQHITLNDVKNSNYFLELSNYFFSICSLNEYDFITADIHIKITTVISYFYIPWAVIPPNSRAIKKESIFTINSYGSLIELDDEVFKNTKIPKNSYPALIKDSWKRNEMKKQELNLALLSEKAESQESLDSNSSFSEGEPLNMSEGEPLNMSEGEPFNMSEGEPLNMSEGEPLNMSEGEPFNMSEGEPLNMSEGEPLNMSEGEPFNMSEGEPLNMSEGEIFTQNENLSNLEETQNYSNEEDNKKPLPNLQRTSNVPLNLPNRNESSENEEEYQFDELNNQEGEV